MLINGKRASPKILITPNDKIFVLLYIGGGNNINNKRNKKLNPLFKKNGKIIEFTLEIVEELYESLPIRNIRERN